MAANWREQFGLGVAEIARAIGSYGIELLGAVLILIVGWLVAGLASRWARRLLDGVPAADATLKPLAVSIVRYGILLVTILAVLAQFGVQTTSIIAVLGAAGLAIGLALQGTLSNVASGVMLLILRPFGVGDFIESGAVRGSVEEVGLFTTILRTPENTYLSVPNKLLFEGPINNATRWPTRFFEITFGVAHGADLDRTLDEVRAALMADKRVLSEPAPMVGVNAITELDVKIWVRASCALSDLAYLPRDLNRVFKQRLEQAGIAFPAPGWRPAK